MGNLLFQRLIGQSRNRFDHSRIPLTETHRNLHSTLVYTTFFCAHLPQPARTCACDCCPSLAADPHTRVAESWCPPPGLLGSLLRQGRRADEEVSLPCMLESGDTWAEHFFCRMFSSKERERERGSLSTKWTVQPARNGRAATYRYQRQSAFALK